MSQRLTSGSRGGKKEKYVPMKDRPQNNTVPLYDQPEAQPYLLTVESMLEKSTATLQDSIWARPRPNAITPTRQPPRQPSHNVQKMSPVIKVEALSPTAWSTEASKPSGLVGSRWAVQAPYAAHPKPEGMTSMNVFEPSRTSVPHPSRGNPSLSHVPLHLQGIHPSKANEALQPVVQTVVRDLAMPNPDPAPASPFATNHNAEGEEWARKMGLFPKSAQAKRVPATKTISRGRERQQTSSMDNVQTKNNTLTQNNPGGHGSQQNSTNIAQMQTRAVSQNGRGLTNAFDNKRFHLKRDNTEQFQKFVQNSTATNGKKYTFNGPIPAPAAPKQQHAAATNGKNPSPNRPALAPQQQSVVSHKPTTQQFLQNGMDSNEMKTENSLPFAKSDPHAMFSPNKTGTSKGNAKTVIVCENVAVLTAVHNGRWPSLNVSEDTTVNGNIIHELKANEYTPTIGAPLTQDALVTITGSKPRDHSLNFEDQVSDDGVVEQTKEGIRASQGVDAATQLLDWDKKRWAPPPCDWENDRAGFDDSFIPEYIKEWRADLPCGPSIKINTACDDFRLGKCPVDNDILIDAIEQPESTPDIANSCDEMKRLHQTAIIDANNYLARMEKKQRNSQKNREYSQARHLEIAIAVDEPNPFSPKIDMYVRPAQEKDAGAIMQIYNHYVATSIIPEDQEPISIDDAVYLIQNCKKEKLPFVVAVKGRLPPNLDAQGRPRPAKAVQPQVESVIGFAFAERFNYAFTGKVNGRSRGTVSIQLYVHPEHTRKGIGRNTLDHLLHCMATAYTFKNGCPWINPERDPVHEPNGSGLIHQMIMQVPVLKKNDPTFPWLSKFLYNKFWFKEENRMKSVARASIYQGAAYFVDLAILQCELLHEAEFEAFN